MIIAQRKLIKWWCEKSATSQRTLYGSSRYLFCIPKNMAQVQYSLIFICWLQLQNIDANMVFLEDLLKDDGVPFQTTNSTDSKRTTMRLQMYYAKPRPLECTKYVGTCAAIENRITDYLGAVDVKLSYGTTSARKESFDPVNFLERGLRLKYHARCWQTVQPLIFAVAVPKCVDSQKRLIPRRLCRDAHDICGEYVLNALPQAFEPLKTCEDDDIFTDYINCEVKFCWFCCLHRISSRTTLLKFGNRTALVCLNFVFDYIMAMCWPYFQVWALPKHSLDPISFPIFQLLSVLNWCSNFKCGKLMQIQNFLRWFWDGFLGIFRWFSKARHFWASLCKKSMP